MTVAALVAAYAPWPGSVVCERTDEKPIIDPGPAAAIGATERAAQAERALDVEVDDPVELVVGVVDDRLADVHRRRR